MRSSLVCAAVLAVLACASMAAAQTPFPAVSTNMRWHGFTFGSDVVGYMNMTMDQCAIKAALAAGNWTRFEEVYFTGANSRRGVGLRTYGVVFSLTNHSGEYAYDALSSFNGDGDWAAALARRAIATQNAALAAASVHAAVTKYMLHEVDSGLARVEAGNSSNITTGAPHNIDEAVALYVGGKGVPACDTLYSTAHTLAIEMGTTFARWAEVNAAVAVSYTDLWYAASVGDAAAARAAARAVYGNVIIRAAQGVLREAYRANLAANCRKASAVSDALSSLEGYWRIAGALLNRRGANVADLSEVLSSADAATSYALIKEHLVRAVAEAGLSPVDLGLPRPGSLNSDLKCAARTLPKP